MSSEFGKILKVHIFGQSHGGGIGVVVDGLPAGERVDLERVSEFMARRAPGNAEYATKRREADIPEILGGIACDVTCGAPLAAVIRNTDTKSGDYDELRRVPRPGHADYTAAIKYGGAADVRGGGHFSGRLTAPLCFAGAVALQLLERRGVDISAHVHSIGGINDKSYDPCIDRDALIKSRSNGFPVIDEAAGEAMQRLISEAARDGDSVGGVIECAAVGLPVGLGAPMFDGVENVIARAAFGIPAVKGIEFGAGFAGAGMRGSENNDEYAVKDGRVTCTTNNAGGVLGGITNGMPLIFRLAIKPTPSIARAQKSVDFVRGEECTLEIKGRHDPCIVPRAVPCVESIAALTILDMYIQQ